MHKVPRGKGGTAMRAEITQQNLFLILAGKAAAVALYQDYAGITIGS